MELTRDPPFALGIIRKPQDILICCVYTRNIMDST